MDHGTRKTITFRGMFEDDVWGADPSFAERVEDLERDPDGVWRACAGALQFTDWLPNTGDGDAYNAGNITSIVWFQTAPNQRYLVYEAADPDTENVSRLIWLYDNYSTWAATRNRVIAERRRPPGRGAPSTFLQVNHWLYHFNGLEHPIRWDGRNAFPAGWPGPAPAPRVSGTSEGFSHPDSAGWDGGAGGFAHTGQRGVGTTPASGTNRWTYACGLTVENDLGQESPMSALAYAHGENSATNGRFGIRWKIPRMPDQARVVHLWRSININGAAVADAPTMYRLESFPIASEIDYIDLAPDEELGIAHVPDAVGPFPLNVRVAAHWRGRMWVAVGERLRFSAPLFHEVFPGGNDLAIGTPATGEITAIKAIPSGLVVFKRGGVYLVKWDGINSPLVDALDETEGTVAPRAIEYVSGIGLVFLGTSGPRVLQGSLDADQPTAVVPLRGCRRTWRRMVVGSAIENAWVVHRPEVEEVWFHVPQNGEVDPSLGFVFHYGDRPGGTWSLRPRWYFSSAVRYRGRVWLGHTFDRYTDDGFPYLCVLAYNNDMQALYPPLIPYPAPPDPTAPYTRGLTTAGGGVVGAAKVSEYVLPLYVSGTVVSPDQWFSVQALELRSIVTGTVNAFQVQIRHGRGTTFEATNDKRNLTDRHAEDDTREVWENSSSVAITPNAGKWDATKFWHDHEPGFVARSVNGRLTRQFQVRIEGMTMRVAGMDLHIGTADGPGPALREVEPLVGEPL